MLARAKTRMYGIAARSSSVPAIKDSAMLAARMAANPATTTEKESCPISRMPMPPQRSG